MKRTRTAAVLAVTILAAPLAGCATPSAVASGTMSTSETTSASETMPDLPEKDIAHWVMPMDQFTVPALDHLSNYALNRQMETCMTGEGFTWPIPIEPTDDASYLAYPKNPSSFPALTVEIAKQFGYRANYIPGVWLPDGRQTFTKLNRIAASSPGFEPVFQACLDASRKIFDDTKVMDIYNTQNMWHNEATKDVFDDPAAQKAGAAWKQCLANAGYDVDISAPITENGAMPTQKLGEEIGLYMPRPTTPPRADGGTYGDTEADPDAERPAPTSAEIGLAVADATCRDSSGWTKAIYDALWNADLLMIRNHGDQLKRMKTELDAMSVQARQIVTDNPPLH